MAAALRARSALTHGLFGRPPDRSNAEDLRRYQLHMRSIGASATSMNAAVSALRFFFGVTLGRGDAQAGMTSGREPPCRRQIPIDRTARTAEPGPPAVSTLEACPTPADRASGRHLATAGVREPLTTTVI